MALLCQCVRCALLIFSITVDICRKVQEKSEKDIMREIQAIIRQITSSVSFLPLLDFPCTRFGPRDEAVAALPCGVVLTCIPSACLKFNQHFLPSLPRNSRAGSFDLLVYTKADCAVPAAWEESDPKYIAKSNEVRLRSFTTKVHKVDTMVSYSVDDC